MSWRIVHVNVASKDSKAFEMEDVEDMVLDILKTYKEDYSGEILDAQGTPDPYEMTYVFRFPANQVNNFKFRVWERLKGRVEIGIEDIGLYKGDPDPEPEQFIKALNQAIENLFGDVHPAGISPFASSDAAS